MEGFKKPTPEKQGVDIEEKEHKAYAELESIPLPEGGMLEFLKVRHTPETLEKFGDTIEEHVKSAEVLISEMEISENQDASMDIEIFYKKVTELARQYKKEMVVADPEKNLQDAIKDIAIVLAPGLAAAGSGVYLAKKISELMAKLEDNKIRKEINAQKNSTPLISRRGFLKGLGALSVMTAGGMNFTASFLEEFGVGKEKGEILEKFLLSALDYRNALITQEILKQAQEHEKISMIYGAAHVSGIKKFLADRKLLAEKIEIYEKTYGVINHSETAIYDFSDLEENINT